MLSRNSLRDTLGTTVFSTAHFVTDFTCAFLIYAYIYGTDNLPVKLLLYNFCAFALQMPVGLIADKINKNGTVAALGCAATVIACALAKFPYAAVITAGLGNALFHVGGGLYVMNLCEAKFAKLGIFVAPGALGIFLGTLAGKAGAACYYAILLSLIFTALILYVSYRTRSIAKYSNSPLSLNGIKSTKSVLALVCLFFVVILRSYAGMLFDFPWKSGTTAVIFVLGVVFGKALGGVFSDRLGLTLTSTASLITAGILFLFSDNAVCGIIAVFLFNMTMPITLGIAAKILNGTKGFSFGILTFALFIGCIPEFSGFPEPLTGSAAYCIICAVSLILLLMGIRLSGGLKNE